MKMNQITRLSGMAQAVMLIMVSFVLINHSHACSERLTYNIQGTLSNRGSVNIHVTGNYIDVNWEVANTYTGGFVDVYIRDGYGNDKLLKNGTNQVSPGDYFLHMDWRQLLSADVTVTFECGSTTRPSASRESRSTYSQSRESRANNTTSVNHNINRNQSDSRATTPPPSDRNYRLNRFQPSENVIRAELREFRFNNNDASVKEAKEILIYLGANEISQVTSSFVSGSFSTGMEITIWPNTYNKYRCYGVRYGNAHQRRAYFGSNATYFEICK